MHRRAFGLWSNSAFMKLWMAQTVSFIGSQVTSIALPLTAVVTLQASPIQMSLLRAVDIAPALLVGLFVGAFVDRVRRRPLLIMADCGRALLLATIPVAWYLGVLDIGHLYGVALLSGMLTVLFDVAHTSLVPTLIPREQLQQGNSLLEVSRSFAMIIGAGLTGILVHLLTAPRALLIDACSFLISALCLLSLRTAEPNQKRPASRPRLWTDVAEGLRTVWNQPLLRTMAVSLCVFNFFSNGVSTLYVLYVVRELGIGPGGVASITAIGSTGFLVGAAFAGPVARYVGVGPTIVWGAGISDAAFLLIPIAGLHHEWTVALLILAQFIATLAGPVTAITQLSLRQALTPDHLLGRVNGTMRVLTIGAAPLGALVAGLLANLLGLRTTLLLGALGIQLGFIILLLSPLRTLRDQP